MKSKKLLFTLAGLGLSLLFSLAAAESTVRYVFGIYPENYHDLFVADARLGHRNRPNFQGTISRADARARVSTNGLGLRGPEPKAAHAASEHYTLVLGDSFAFGFGVGDAETVSMHTEPLLAGLSSVQFAPGKSLHFFNAGVVGYSTVQELLYFETELARLKPELVILLFYIDDVEQNAGLHALLSGGTAPPQPGSARSLGNTLRRHSALAFLGSVLLERYGWRTPFPRREFVGSYYMGEVPEANRAWEISQAVLARFAASVKSAGAEFIVAWVPEPLAFQGRAGHAAFARTYGYTEFAEANYDPDLPRQRFHKICRELKLACFDPTADFAFRLSRGETLFYALDKHWTPAGSRAFAESLVSFLASRARQAP